MKFANKTSVGSDKSKAEIEKTIVNYGAIDFGYMNRENHAIIAFKAEGRAIRMTIPLPNRDDFRMSPGGRHWTTIQALKAYDQAGRQRWRALALIVKAKLEAVESGVATFEEEFMPYIVIPGGKTVGQVMIPQIASAYKGGEVPLLLGEAKA